MLRRFGPWAMGVLVGAGAACGQEPIPASAVASGMPSAALTGPVQQASFGVGHDPHAGGWLRSRAMTDPLGANAELAGLREEANPWHAPSCEAPGLRYGRKRPFGGDPDAGQAADFQAANAWSRTNVEKKLFIDYYHGSSYSTITKLAYGQSNGTTIGMEVLPWVLRDDDAKFTRMGWLAAFDYQAYKGNLGAVITSELSGNTLSASGGQSFGALLGPSWRSDFHVFGLRVSPNISTGIILDWTSMRQAAADPAVVAAAAAAQNRPPNELPALQPQVLGGPNFPWLTPQSSIPVTSVGGVPFYSVPRIKLNDFAVGGYVRSMLDFPIRSHLNLGVGFDVRFTSTGALLRDSDYRKHVGLILQIGGDF